MSSKSGHLAVRLDDLREHDPQAFGYLTKNWEAVKEGLDNTARSYARASRIHDNIPDADLSTRALGNTLRILQELGVLETRTERNNANLYDLDSYDPGQLEAVGRLLEEQ